MRKVVSQEVAFINAEMQLIEQENFLGMGKKAKARRAEKRNSNSDEWMGNWNSTNETQRTQNTSSSSKNQSGSYEWKKCGKMEFGKGTVFQ